MPTTITVRVNGLVETHPVEANQTLLAFLRDTLDLTGAKEGAVNACLILAVETDGHEITTIEGLGDGSHLHPLQQAFLTHSAVQCGFCSPGMIMTALGLLNENPTPTEADIRTALSGSLCRCTGYRQIIDAVQEAATIQRQRAEVAP